MQKDYIADENNGSAAAEFFNSMGKWVIINLDAGCSDGKLIWTAKKCKGADINDDT